MKSLEDQIIAHPGKAHAPLLSVRALAHHFGISPQTVHKVLRNMQSQGLVYSIPNKGFYWGDKPRVLSLPLVQTNSKSERVKEQLLSDLQCGVYHPYKALPSKQALAQIYHVAVTRIGDFLEEFVTQGVLTRQGRSLMMTTPQTYKSKTTLLVVSRCNSHGQLLFDSERETDFMKSIQRERLEQNLHIVVAGWHEDEHGHGAFLDQQGKELSLHKLPGILLGIIVSTWLIQKPLSLLAKLWTLRVPISVWWELPPQLFPTKNSQRPSTLGFNLSFGVSPGITVGRHLYALGFHDIAFISPFHGSEWSRNRLEGLRVGLANYESCLKAYVDANHENAWEFHRDVGVAEGERLIRKILANFLDQTDLMHTKVWVTVNDHTAIVLLEILKERGLPRPYVVSFDNSTICEAYQIDSFEFHTEGMVRQMLYHIQQPTAILFKSGGIYEMVGRFVCRQTEIYGINRSTNRLLNEAQR